MVPSAQGNREQGPRARVGPGFQYTVKAGCTIDHDRPRDWRHGCRTDTQLACDLKKISSCLGEGPRGFVSYLLCYSPQRLVSPCMSESFSTCSAAGGIPSHRIEQTQPSDNRQIEDGKQVSSMERRYLRCGRGRVALPVLYFACPNSSTSMSFQPPLHLHSYPPPRSFLMKVSRSGPTGNEIKNCVDPRPELPRWNDRARESGSHSGGMAGILNQTHSETSHPERGQGGPRGESAERNGYGGASDARGLEVAKGWGATPSPSKLRESNGPVETFSSLLGLSSSEGFVGRMTLR